MRNLTYLKECFSTNDEVIELLKNENATLTASYTFYQKKGRGQYGNVWESSKNLNIAFSIAFTAELVQFPIALFNFYTALILRDFVANMTKLKTEIKWPNDLIINNKKIAGILIEKVKVNTDFYFIIGVGLNVLQTEFEKYPHASSLKTETSQNFNLHEICYELFDFLQEKIQNQHFLHFEISSYEQHLFRKDKIAVFTVNNVRQNGIIKKVDKNGNLYVDLERDGLTSFYNKEIIMHY